VPAPVVPVAVVADVPPAVAFSAGAAVAFVNSNVAAALSLPAVPAVPVLPLVPAVPDVPAAPAVPVADAVPAAPADPLALSVVPLAAACVRHPVTTTRRPVLGVVLCGALL